MQCRLNKSILNIKKLIIYNKLILLCFKRQALKVSGGHTIGLSHWSSFENKLYNLTTGDIIVDTTMGVNFASILYSIFPVVNVTSDHHSKHFRQQLIHGPLLFFSDLSMYFDFIDTKNIVNIFASNQTMFFTNFILVVLKMGRWTF